MKVGGQEVSRQHRYVGTRLVLVTVLYVALALAAAFDLPLGFAIVLVAISALDLVGTPPAHFLRLLRLGGLNPSALGLLEALSFGVLLARHFPEFLATAKGGFLLLLLLPLSRALFLLVAFAWRVRFLRPIAIRNIDVGSLSESLSPSLAGIGEARLVRLGSIPLVVGALGIAANVLWPFLLLALAYVLLVLGASMILAARVLGVGGLPSNSEWLRRAMQRIRSTEPEIIVYFSGAPDAVYQVNMWLDALADMDRRVLILLRERSVMARLAPTDLPIVCMPDSVTVMSAKFPTARVAFYMSHAGKNIHLLREPGLRHVFIGHGDSDKVSSVNPFAKAYDELWVAGPAARERWAAADVGIRNDAVVEVGRPQLVEIDRADDQNPQDRRRVLYAPTWEGWTDEDFGTSITDMGPVLIEGLLSADPSWEIIYKPHPFTGRRDPRAQRSHTAIVAMLNRANGLSAEPTVSTTLTDLRRRMSEPGLSARSFAELAREWNNTYWELHPPGQHLVVDDDLPTLFACFNQADLMIADVSSVVSDFLASGKPYVCANPRGLEPQQFLRENPTTGGAYLLSPDCLELNAILAEVRGGDPMAPGRLALRDHILGPAEPPSIERWRRAVDRLAATAHVGARSDLDPDLMEADTADLQHGQNER